jgi:hypothetical protein
LKGNVEPKIESGSSWPSSDTILLMAKNKDLGGAMLQIDLKNAGLAYLTYETF